jgi:CMP-N-acetylneuraminic acid synthetase
MIAFIFARGGSKGVVDKNIRLINGKPLIGIAIETAMSVRRITEVVVSTDSQEIAEVALSFGAKVPFMRPLSLSEDHTPEWLAWRHALMQIEDLWGEMPETFISIPTTAPLRIASDIERCIDEFEKNIFDLVITVNESHKSPYFNMVRLIDTGEVTLFDSSFKDISRRQDAPKVYDITTVCYVGSSRHIMNSNSLFEGKVGAIEIPRERALDIDTELDLEVSRIILEQRYKL